MLPHCGVAVPKPRGAFKLIPLLTLKVVYSKSNKFHPEAVKTNIRPPLY